MPPDDLDIAATVADAPAPTLHEALGAAYDAAADVPAAGSAEARPPAPAAAETPVKPADAVRGPDGRFAPKAAQDGPAQASPKTETPGQTPAAEAQIAPIAPPASWAPAAKAKFATLDPEVQTEVLKRERDMDAGRAQWEQGAQRLNRLDQVLAPRRDRLALAGVDEAQAVASLFAAQDVLERTPVDGLLYLGRQFGVDWRALFSRLQGQPGSAQAQPMPPGMQQIAQQVQSLTQTVQQRDQAAQRAMMEQVDQQIAAFAADPANPYYANVKGEMGRLIGSKQAATLAEAYEKATWSDPAIRPLLIQAQAADQQRKAAEEAKARTAAARQASGSVTGSPTPGARAAAGPKGTVSDTLSQVWDQLAGA